MIIFFQTLVTEMAKEQAPYFPGHSGGICSLVLCGDLCFLDCL